MSLTPTSSLQWETRDGTATVSGGDYVGASGTLIFASGETSKPITITVNGDTTVEAPERFTVHLLDNPVNGIIGDGDGTGSRTIQIADSVANVDFTGLE